MYKVLEAKFALLLILLAMMDYKKRIVDLEVGWPGSVADRQIWSCSTLNKVYKAWLQQLPTTSLPTGMHLSGDEIYKDISPFILGESRLCIFEYSAYGDNLQDDREIVRSCNS